MEQVKLDTALEELELRLERLRALYEQYFMGLEKIEPQIARKDVDRRIYVLRREKIRNTAKRFKLQTIIQRYNTFQQYWQRICREIENGTYKRHLLKAQKHGELLTIAARKRLGRQARTAKPDEAAAPSQPPPAEQSAPPSAPPPAEPAAATPPPAAQPVAQPAPPPPKTLPFGSPPIPPRAPPPKPAPAKFESLDLDMDFMGDWDPSATRTPQKPAVANPKPAMPAPAARAAPPVAAPPVAAPPPKPAAAAAPPAPAAARPASIPPAPVAAPPRPASSRPPTAPLQPAAPRPPMATRPLGAAPPPKPLAANRPAAAPPPKPAPAAAAASPNADDASLRALHAKLQQAKQQTKEGNVSFEGLAKSIRATEARLREQHKNRRIDFDVVIKDGKAVVKPIIR